MKHYRYQRFFCWMIGVLMPLCLLAQNNPYKIDDSLFPLYQRANQYRTRAEGLAIADSLYKEAVRINDKKAQCLALVVPVYYYYTQFPYEKFEAATRRLKEVSRRNGYLQYYYFACENEINFLLKDGRSLAALQKAEEVRTQAFKDQHVYGIYSCLRMMGNIYWERSDIEQAVEYYRNALEYMLENLPEQDPTQLYQYLSQYYRHKQDYTKAMEYIDKGMNEAKTPQNKISIMLEKCMLLWEMEDENGFEACYEECLEGLKQYGVFQKEVLETLQIYKMILEGRYGEAHKAADKMGNRWMVLRMHETVYAKAGDFEKAYHMQVRREKYQDSIDSQMQADDLAELNMQVGLERMKLEAQSLQLENAELSAKNAIMELEQTKSQMEMERMNAENSRLQLHNQNLEYERLKLDTERQEAVLKEQQAAAQHHIVVLSLILVILLISIAFLIFYVYKRSRSMIYLRHKNEELKVARDQAEQADKMKTFFIQNMSHEIRTPLNAIVGFSQLLFDSSVELGEDEKRQFSMLIQQNSDLLTTLINDILDLANLESGKYTMNIESHCCNEVCRMALSTVAHRKPESVRLYFTSEVSDDFRIRTDGNRLRQVLINFLTNAEKYTEKGEIHVHCSLAEHPGCITFSVTDTGTGVSVDKAETIFERFKKLDEFKQGTGLGLNICRIIAERLHGEVKLDKSYTKGARFLFVLPLDEPATEQKEANPAK